jgi:hypothetical protein
MTSFQGQSCARGTQPSSDRQADAVDDDDEGDDDDDEDAVARLRGRASGETMRPA